MTERNLRLVSSALVGALAMGPLVLGCSQGSSSSGTSGTAVGTSTGEDESGVGEVEQPTVDEVTSKIAMCFVIHNEEDDADGIPSSADMPDYNGDQAVFDHFADAMLAYATMLSEYGATLSFQPDWTFVEGVENFRPEYFRGMLALGNVEILPHAHESYVSYDELYGRLEALGAQPPKIMGGLLYDQFLVRQSWFDANPGWVFWGGPTGSVAHTDDLRLPPMAYRIPMPEDVSVSSDLNVHTATSPLIVTPGLPANPAMMLQLKPRGRYLTQVYPFQATRYFLAESDDTTVPERWRKPSTNGTQPVHASAMSAAELIANTRTTIEQDYLPLVDQGLLEFKTVGEIVDRYRAYESQLDLFDGQDLSLFAGGAPN